MTRSALFAGVLAALAAPAAFAQSSTDITVTGTLTPAACTPVLAGNGVVDFGKISAADLNTDTHTVLPLKELSFTITCSAPTLIAVTHIGGRFDSIVHGGNHPGWSLPVYGGQTTGAGSNFDGLGRTPANELIGGYVTMLKPGSFQADGSAVEVIYRNTNFAADDWRDSATGITQPSGGIRRFQTFAVPGTLTPIAVESVSGTLGIQAGIARSSGLTLTDEVTLDGASTLEIVYL